MKQENPSRIYMLLMTEHQLLNQDKCIYSISGLGRLLITMHSLRISQSIFIRYTN